MPPLNREDDHNHHSSGIPSSGARRTTNHHRPCPIPNGSCTSLEKLERIKASHSQNNDNEKKGSRKRVTFHTGSELRSTKWIASFSEWSPEEQASRWYTQEEYGNLRRDVFHTLYLLRNRPESLDGVSYTARGVECRDPAVVGRRQRYKQLAWQAVFEEQEALRKDGDASGDRDWLATLYSNAARPALHEALDLAALDEVEANQIYREEQQRLIPNEDDAFSDDWIRSISSHSTDTDDSITGFSHKHDEESGFCVFGPASAFDDDWIRGN
ncbi:hypothetical protein IV203_016131 [Nitzschia inconspicua]|uniref:Uncharacterized protein n=1 Tax=Nitzschia inconspicua TaxID=303405 RepID=A0A9K3PHY0_9STRA|nr:hypothetical protein IV203_016131 [Nitzschia inconspicua]